MRELLAYLVSVILLPTVAAALIAWPAMFGGLRRRAAVVDGCVAAGLALAFLIMIGALLVAEGCHQKIGKGYVYFAMAFSIMVEVLQMWAYPTPPPVEIATHEPKPE